MTSYFEEEILSQPGVLRTRQAQRVARSWRGITYALVGARGSSDMPR